MGMFDWVAFEMDCPVCCTPVRGFQTKDRRSPDLQVVLPHVITNFYASCSNELCNAYIEFADGKMVSPICPDNDLPYPPDGKPGYL